MSSPVQVVFVRDPARAPHVRVETGRHPDGERWGRATLYFDGRGGELPLMCDAVRLLLGVFGRREIAFPELSDARYFQMWPAAIASVIEAAATPALAAPVSAAPLAAPSAAPVSAAPALAAPSAAPAATFLTPDQFRSYPPPSQSPAVPPRQPVPHKDEVSYSQIAARFSEMVGPKDVPAEATDTAQLEELVYQKILAYARQFGSHPDFGAFNRSALEKGRNYIVSVYGSPLPAALIDRVRARLAGALARV